MSKKRDYEIGRGKPPRATRFAPGKSGNPKGRPKVATDLQAEIDREFKQRVVVHENGKTKRITKRKATAIQLVNAAASGKLPAVKVLMAGDRTRGQQEISTQNKDDAIFDTQDHRLTIQNIVRRIRALDPEQSVPASSGDPSPEDDRANEGAKQ